jgi:hypothetical protein
MKREAPKLMKKRTHRINPPKFDARGYQSNISKSWGKGIEASEPVNSEDISWLPSPEEFAEMRRTTKITINLSNRSLKLLKHKAQSCQMPYQTLIRNVVDKYAEGIERSKTSTR